METKFGGNRKVASILSHREANTVGSWLKSCAPHEEPRASMRIGLAVAGEGE